jgi:hypothetical protein
MPTTYAIPDGRTVMAATLYTGNSGTQSIVNAVNGVFFAPDFVWIKDRSAARQNSLNDIVRGTNKELFSDSTDAETSPGTPVLTAFNSNGFSVGANAVGNQSGENFVAWQWKANGSGVSNTAGSITSTVDANTTAGFSVVTFTGTGANDSVGHGLGVTPNMIILKRRNSTSGWLVYHSSLATPSTQWLQPNTTDAVQTASPFWNTVNSTTFGTSANTTINTATYVAYCFAAIAGYSAFGSYTGNGSTDGPFVYLGFRPRFIMVKRTDAAEGWEMLDTSRNTYNAVNSLLEANQSSAEITSTSRDTDFTSNGFKVRNTSNAMNASGGTYIYACFAENPFKYSNAR